MDDLMQRAAAKVEEFVRNSEAFKQQCDVTFGQLDWQGRGRVNTSDAVAATGAFFEHLSEQLSDYGLAVEEPSADEVRALVRDCGLAGKEQLNRDQFDMLYLAVLKVAAGKCVKSFVRKYGTGMLVGTAGLFIAKRTLRAVPIVGLLASPVLALLPTLLLGPAIGVVGVYCMDHGGVSALKGIVKSLRRGGGGFIAG